MARATRFSTFRPVLLKPNTRAVSLTRSSIGTEKC